MFTKEAIETLSKAEAISAAASAIIHSPPIMPVALPNDMALHDLEDCQLKRRRARGAFNSTSLNSFARYAAEHKEDGATVFVNPEAMTATAVLNLGTPDAPGHADNIAKLALPRTAAYAALRTIANGQGRKQSEIAEFLEDWAEAVTCFNETGSITPPKAIAAIRKITIEALRKLESTEQQLSASRSAFETVAATSTEPLPTYVYFNCEPYADIASRSFVLRLGILTTNDKPAITLRIVKIDEHEEAMGAELSSKIDAEFSAVGAAVPSVLGTYTKGK